MPRTSSQPVRDEMYRGYEQIPISELLAGNLPPSGTIEGALRDRRTQLLHSITPNVDNLLLLMETFQLVITGSAAVRFALPQIEQNDFDILAPRSHRDTIIRQFARWGYRKESFEDQSSSRQGLHPIPSIATVTRLTRRKPRSCIDLIRSTTEDTLLPLFSFHGTAPMNFLSSKAFFMAYPETTLSMHNAETAFYKSDASDEAENIYRKRKLTEKYEMKGFTSIAFPYPQHRLNDPLCGKAIRYVGDKHSLYIVLDKDQDGVRGEVNNYGSPFQWRLGGADRICANCDAT